MIVTASKLMAATTKLMLFHLSKYIDAQNIYSCWMEGSKLDVFRMFKTKYPTARLMAIGDGKQEAQAAKDLRIPFVAISAAQGAESAVKDLVQLTKTFEEMAERDR